MLIMEYHNVILWFRAGILSEQMNDVRVHADNVTQRIKLSSVGLDDLRIKMNYLNDTLESLKNNATKLQEGNVEGAQLISVIKNYVPLYYTRKIFVGILVQLFYSFQEVVFRTLKLIALCIQRNPAFRFLLRKCFLDLFLKVSFFLICL